LSTVQSVYLLCSLTREVTLSAWARNMNEYVKLNLTVSRNVTLRSLVHTNVAGKLSAPILSVEDYYVVLTQQITRIHIPEYINIHSLPCEKLNSLTIRAAVL
jgi:hypothetical protein